MVYLHFKSHSRKGKACVVSIDKAIDMMLNFGMFIVALIGVIVSIVNSTKK